MKKQITTTIIFLIFCLSSFSQALYYVQENFERTDSAYFWTVNPIIANKTWKYTYGGQWFNGGFPYNPEIPLQGEYNAGLYFPSTTLDSVKLISPTLELEGAKKPMLRFWHCQYTRPFKGPDNLRLYFKPDASHQWEKIEEWTSDISFWQEEVYDISELMGQYLTDEFQFAFEGVIGNGYGVYIDSVTVLEEEVVQKFVKKTTYTSVDHTIIPSSATDVPIERIKIRILGNSGSAILKSLSIVPQGDGVNYLETTNFKLFSTRSEYFAPYVADTSTLIATGILSDGKITFSGMNHNMTLGDNNFWIAASFKSTLSGTTSFSCYVPIDGISVNDTLFPKAIAYFNETHVVKESVLYEDFETSTSGWTFEGNFEVGWPDGNYVDIQANPNTPYNGQKVLDTDLNGGYFPDITPSTAYYAYTPILDLTYYINIGLYMQSYFSINGPDKAVIDISTDSGSSWQNIWQSSTATNNSYWTEFLDQNINETAKHKPQFQLRMGINDSKTIPWPGLSIDNFAILGERLHTDVGVTQIISPINDCKDCGSDTVKAWFRNYAQGTAPTVIPVFYGLWGVGSTLVYDTIYGGINQDDSVLFTFTRPANFPIGDYYNNFVVGVDLPGDQDATNDTLTKPLVIQENNTPPHFENFEFRGGVWLKSNGSSWTNMDMSGTIETNPLSPNIWVLSPSGNYMNSDTSFVGSGCYNLSDASRNIVKLKYWSDCEESYDGARLEYSIDDGITWNIVLDTIHGAGWNWTINTVEALGSPGWSGIHNWINAKALIPEAADIGSKVRFRILFSSNDSDAHAQGFAFDDFEIFPAPPDVGVSSIVSPFSACQGNNVNTTSLYVRNYGYNKLDANDTIVVGVDFESESPVIQSFILNSDLDPGDSVQFTVNTNFDLSEAKTYNLSAYTLIEDDPFYYLSNNDTFSFSFTIWPNPGIILPDTIGSRQPDTLMIVPQYPNWEPGYTYLWQDNITTDSIFDVVNEGPHWVTATEPNHGCHTTDSVLVVLLYFDAGATEIVYPQSTCELSDSELVQIRVANVGTDSLLAGDRIALTYSVNGGMLAYDTLTVPYTLRYNMSLIHTFSDDPYNFSASGAYTILATASYVGGDENSSNDDVTDVATVYGFTPLNIGSDSLVVQALNYTLDAGIGFYKYNWSNDSTTKTINVNTSGDYWVVATDSHECQSADTINIWFKIRDIRTDILVSPVTACERTALEEVRVRVINEGTDTITTSNSITIKYRIDGGSYLSETFNPPYDLTPYTQFTHEFATPVNISNFQSYLFDVVASTPGDLRLNNDSIQETIDTYENPTVYLGEDRVVNGFQEVLDAGSGVNYTYTWQDNTTHTQTYVATSAGTYICVVTNSLTGCWGSDTVFLDFDISDLALQSVSVANQVCQGPRNNVTADVLNNGTKPRTNTSFSIAYKINNGAEATQTFNVSAVWMPGSTQRVTFTNPFPFTTIGNNALSVYFDEYTDLNPANDQISRSIIVLESPVVNFGGDTIKVNLPYQLNAGNHESYQWQDNSTGQYFTVTTPGIYSVTVTNAANCITTQSVFVDFATFINNAAAENLDVRLYPNPANDFLNIEANLKTGKDLLIEIFDINNHLIYSEKHNGFDVYSYKLDVSTLTEGLYFIRFSNNEVLQINRFIIK